MSNKHAIIEREKQMSKSYEEQKEAERAEMFKEEAREALRENTHKAVEHNGANGSGHSDRPDGDTRPPASVEQPKVIQVVTPGTPTMLIVAMEQCLAAYDHLNQNVDDREHAKQDALEYVMNRNFGRV